MLTIKPLPRLLGAAAVALAFLSGCSASGEQEQDVSLGPVEQAAEDARRAGQDEVYALLRDGEASQSDYETAMDSHLECMRSAGLIPAEPTLNRADQLQFLVAVDYGALDVNEGSDRQAECYSNNLGPVETAYLSTHTARMEEPLRAYTADCLTGQGVTLNGGEQNFAEFVDAAGEAQELVVRDCVTAAFGQLYPTEFFSLSR